MQEQKQTGHNTTYRRIPAFEFIALTIYFFINLLFAYKYATRFLDHPLIWMGALRNDRSIEAYEKVLEILNNAELITVVTTLRQYENMALESVEVPRNSNLGYAVEMNLSFREVLTAEVTDPAGTTDYGRQNTRIVA